jgi:uncharacterized membrane protein (DUF485 family)
MNEVYQRLDLDQRSSKRSYASIDPILINDDETVPDKGFQRHVTWVTEILGSDKLVVFHEKQRAFRARQKPGTVHFFLASIVFMLLIVFGARTFMASDMFQAGKVHFCLYLIVLVLTLSLLFRCHYWSL